MRGLLLFYPKDSYRLPLMEAVMHRLGWLTPLVLCACMNGAVVNLDAGGSTTDGDSGMPTPTDAGPVMGQGVYQHDVQDAAGLTIALSRFNGEITLMVNVASRCGYTYQYEALQDLQSRYFNQGFNVVGFPANNFGNQEPGTNEEIQEFCTSTYGTTFPIFGKISVLGDDKHPLYISLTEESAEDFRGEVSWNFEKFLVNGAGVVVGRFRSAVEPSDERLTDAIDTLLATP